MIAAQPLSEIPGTTIFAAEQARRGYALNRMCFSFNSAENRAAFLADEEAYCAPVQLGTAVSMNPLIAATTKPYISSWACQYIAGSAPNGTA